MTSRDGGRAVFLGEALDVACGGVPDSLRVMVGRTTP